MLIVIWTPRSLTTFLTNAKVFANVHSHSLSFYVRSMMIHLFVFVITSLIIIGVLIILIQDEREA